MILQPLETTTAGLVISTLQGARQRCISPALALHQAGLLMTQDLANAIRYETLYSAAEQVQKTHIRTLHQLGLTPKDPTPAVAVKAIARRLEAWAEMASKGEFR